MAEKVVTTRTIIDDLDGTEIVDGKGGSVSFALDGTSYVIDLNAKNADKLRAALKPYLDAARKTGRSSATRASAGRNSPEELAAARAWLRANGHDVSDRGRIPANLLEEFRASK